MSWAEPLGLVGDSGSGGIEAAVAELLAGDAEQAEKADVSLDMGDRSAEANEVREAATKSQ